MNSFDTIAAISTPIGVGGIGVIRISGSDALLIADKIFKAPNGSLLAEQPSHTIHYGHIVDPKTNKKADEVLVSVMRAPKTFTAEDVVEISTHGSPTVLKKVLLLVLQNGARHAENGEFTKRAFMNGRIDLSRAEAVIDIISANSDAAISNALNQLEGSLYDKIEEIREPLIYALAQFAAAVDYPDEDISELTEQKLASILEECLAKCDLLLDSATDGRIAKEGILCVLAGKPNAGKSSMLNALAGAERAIVTDIAGTTRDIIEENITIDSVAIRLIDTAGIRQTDDTVEKIGVERCVKYIEGADVVIVLLDASRPLDDEDISVLKLSEGKKRIVILNKSDLEQVIEKSDYEKYINDDIVINASMVDGNGLEKIKETIIGICENKGTAKSVMLSNVRHIAAVTRATQALKNAQNTLSCGMPMDLCAIDVSSALEELGQITGISISEDIVDKIFKEFCVGK